MLCCHQLAGYSSIPEYNSSTTTSYSSIGCYQDSREHENVTSSENQVVSVDSKIDCESQELADETCDVEANSPLMMAKGPLTYSGTLKIDDDGAGSSHGDPNHDPKTSMQINGRSLNADINSYVVVPHWLLGQGVKVGDRVDVIVGLYWTDTGAYASSNIISSIVGDVGPDDKGVGEISIAAARALGFGTRDVNGIGPVPTWNGADCDPTITIIYYPSGY